MFRIILFLTSMLLGLYSVADGSAQDTSETTLENSSLSISADLAKQFGLPEEDGCQSIYQPLEVQEYTSIYDESFYLDRKITISKIGDNYKVESLFRKQEVDDCPAGPVEDCFSDDLFEYMLSTTSLYQKRENNLLIPYMTVLESTQEQADGVWFKINYAGFLGEDRVFQGYSREEVFHKAMESCEQ